MEKLNYFNLPGSETLQFNEGDIEIELQELRSEISRAENNSAICAAASEELAANIDELQISSRERIESFESAGLQQILTNMTAEVQATANLQLQDIEAVHHRTRCGLNTLLATYEDKQARAYALRYALYRPEQY